VKKSAGILCYRWRGSHVDVFIVHPGGPFWKAKDKGAWSIPKGEYADGEDPLTAARREFQEETGIEAVGKFQPLQEIKLKSGKRILAWAVETDFDAANIVSNTFEMEWPLRSGRMQQFPEIDKGDWFTIAGARVKLNEAQAGLLDQLEIILNA
jgi:predicted NUDIX family NTP pyrophosphohydrolase